MKKKHNEETTIKKPALRYGFRVVTTKRGSIVGQAYEVRGDSKTIIHQTAPKEDRHKALSTLARWYHANEKRNTEVA